MKKLKYTLTNKNDIVKNVSQITTKINLSDGSNFIESFDLLYIRFTTFKFELKLFIHINSIHFFLVCKICIFLLNHVLFT